MNIQIAVLKFDFDIRASQIHKFRGFIGNLFKNFDLIHNHDLNTGKEIYRYPLVQFKIIDKKPVIIAITKEAIQIFSDIFMTLEEIDIEGVKIPVYEKNLEMKNVEFGYSEDLFVYEFISPWIGLNQKNHQKYTDSNDSEKQEILQKSLTGNILSMSKYLDYWLTSNQRIKVDLKLKEVSVKLKGKTMIGFTGIFKTNFLIPDFFGIGKSVSRGFGGGRRIL